MPLDRSTRTLIAALLWVAAAFIIINNIVGGSTINDWLLPLLFIVVGAAVYFLPDRILAPGTASDDADIDDTQTRSDALAAVVVSSPAYTELQDPVENMQTDPIESLEETEEVSSPPTAYIARPAPEVNAPKVRAAVPATLSTQERAALVQPTPAPAEPITTPTQAVTDSTDTQARSDAIAAVASEAPAELQDPVENMLTDPIESLEETEEVSGPPTDSAARSEEVPDNLVLIEGIGPKMAAALSAAGITTFAQLAAASEDTLRAAISAAGMRFSPSLPTWAEQAAYAARGDLDGMYAYQKTLTSGRKAKS